VITTIIMTMVTMIMIDMSPSTLCPLGGFLHGRSDKRLTRRRTSPIASD
jgi:hypothetical protein